jgi:hypothetical protein
MHFTKNLFPIAIAAPLLAALSGCAYNVFIGLHEGAERVTLAEASQVADCQTKGGVTVSVFAKGRIEKDVEANLFQMARNSAADAGADTVVKGESPEFGQRTFKFYKCRP